MRNISTVAVVDLKTSVSFKLKEEENKNENVENVVETDAVGLVLDQQTVHTLCLSAVPLLWLWIDFGCLCA